MKLNKKILFASTLLIIFAILAGMTFWDDPVPRTIQGDADHPIVPVLDEKILSLERYGRKYGTEALRELLINGRVAFEHMNGYYITAIEKPTGKGNSFRIVAYANDDKIEMIKGGFVGSDALRAKEFEQR